MLTTIASFFVISSMWAIWFWGIVAFVLICIFSEREENFWAFATVGAFIAVMEYSDIISVFADPYSLLMYLIIYFIIGGAWSFIKWFSFIHKLADKFIDIKLDFIRETYNKAPGVELLPVDATTKIPANAINRFNSVLRNNYLEFKNKKNFDYDQDSLSWVVPQARNFKEKIVTWILWWPFSAIWTLLNDPLVRLANWIYRRFQAVYSKIANKAFSNFNID